jgi:hypothetical protein
LVQLIAAAIDLLGAYLVHLVQHLIVTLLKRFNLPQPRLPLCALPFTGIFRFDF